MSDLDPAARRADARERLGEGEPREAFRVLQPLLAYPREFAAQGEDVELFSEISRALGATSLLEGLSRTQQNPSDVEALYDLGYELIEHDLSGFAASVLSQANELAPNDVRVLTELVAALERELRNADAARVLRAAPELLEEDFLCRYLLAFNALLSGGLAEARQLLPQLQNEGDQRYEGMAQRVEGMLTRADALQGVRPLDEGDLRGWHFVVTGGLLLHVSDAGHEVMHGRYAWVQDDVLRCLEGLRKAQRVLEALGSTPPRVFALPDPHGATLAEAAAMALDLPLSTWPEEGSEEPGLLVAYDLADVGVALRSVLTHRPGQVLLTQAACWTRDFPLSGDLTTFLYQFNTAPWEPQLIVSSEGGELETRDPRAVPLEERAREVACAKLEHKALSDTDELLALVEVARALPEQYSAGLFRHSGQRTRHWAGSPVPSSRFA
jgi:hypothetical protein